MQYTKNSQSWKNKCNLKHAPFVSHFLRNFRGKSLWTDLIENTCFAQHKAQALTEDQIGLTTGTHFSEETSKYLQILSTNLRSSSIIA